MESCPKMSSGVLIDSRYTSRRALSTALEETGLFSCIHQAPSVSAGISFMGGEGADVCIFGPTLSADTVQFVASTLLQSLCTAEVATVRILGSRYPRYEPTAGVVHETVCLPVDCAELRGVVLRAIARAHDVQGGSHLALAGPFSSTPHTSDMFQGFILANGDAFKSTVQWLEVILETLPPLPEMTPRLARGISHLVMEVIPGLEGDENTVAPLREMVEGMLQSWALHYQLYGKHRANAILSDTLAAYATGDFSSRPPLS